jgi:hypothetical protein
VFVLLGFTLMRTLVPGARRFCRHDVWRLLIGSGLGVGVSSLAFVAALKTGTSQLGIEAALLIVLGWLAWRSTECRLCAAPRHSWTRLEQCLLAAFAVVIACAAVAFIRQQRVSPHGAWDAWAIHNLHARFLSRSTDWRDLFTPVLTWTHPDYPLLVPGFVAGWWKLLNTESTILPAATAFLFTLGAPVLLAVSLALLRDPGQGLLAGLLLLSAPHFVTVGAGQFVDVPVGWFLLAASVLLAMDVPAAAGLAAAFGAWTKNDGVLLFVALVLGVSLARHWTVQRLRAFALGALIPLTILLWFKLTIAPPNPLVSSANAVQHLTDPARYGVIAAGFLHHIWTFSGFLVSPFVCLGLCAWSMRPGIAITSAARAVALTLLVAVCGDAAVYMFTTHEPVVQLIDSSLDRLLVQLWPTVVFFVFLVAGPAQRTSAVFSSTAVVQGHVAPGAPVPAARVWLSLTLLCAVVLSGVAIETMRRQYRSGAGAIRTGAANGAEPTPTPPAAAGLLYHIDVVGPVANPYGKVVSAFASRTFEVVGWAVDLPRKLPVNGVDIVIDGRRYAARYGASRPDVAAYLQAAIYDPSGFDLSLAAGTLEKGRHVLSVRIVGSDGRSILESPGIAVIIE